MCRERDPQESHPLGGERKTDRFKREIRFPLVDEG